MSNPTVESPRQIKENGYFDAVSSVFAAHDHPVILVEEGAMRWMGLRTSPEENLDLLVRDSQIDSITKALTATGYYEAVDQDLSFRLNDEYAKQVPRLRDTRFDAGTFTCINFWTESVYMLRVAEAEPVLVRDIYAHNVSLVEERFATIPQTKKLVIEEQQQQNVNVLPSVRSSTMKAEYFIPSIPRMLDAMFDQLRCREKHPETYANSGNRPMYHLMNFTRYLYLEFESQQHLVLPLVAKRNQDMLEQELNSYKRKPRTGIIGGKIVENTR